MKNAFKILLVLIVAVLLASCAFDRAFVISFHDYADTTLYPGSRLNSPVMVQGKKDMANLSRFPFVDFRDFFEGEVYESQEKPGRFGIRLKADQFGINRMMQAGTGHEGEKFAIVIDGFYVGDGVFNLEDVRKGIVELPPLWGKHEAYAIAGHVSDNFTSIGAK